MNEAHARATDWPGCVLAVLFALAGSWTAGSLGFGAAGYLLLVLLIGTNIFAVFARKTRILKSVLFGGSMAAWNVVENHRSLFDSDLYTLVLPLFLGIPLTVAVVAHLLTKRHRPGP